MAPVEVREAGASPVTTREAVLARKDPVASTAHGSGGSGGVDVGRRWRRSGATMNRGDGGGVGREIWGASGGRGGGRFFG